MLDSQVIKTTTYIEVKPDSSSYAAPRQGDRIDAEPVPSVMPRNCDTARRRHDLESTLL